MPKTVLVKSNAIKEFRGEFFFLSNFYPCDVSYEGVRFTSSEHAFQAAKTIDLQERYRIRDAGHPSAAKRIGRKVTLRPGWDEMRIDVMRAVLADKFETGSKLAKLLVETGNRQLIEGNHWGDRYWGMTADGIGGLQGENNLGKLLMERRKALRVS